MSAWIHSVNEADLRLRPGFFRERVVWRHPEWWSLLLSVVAWTMVLSRYGSAAGVSPSHAHSGHVMDGSGPLWIAEMLQWLVMVVAMMVPLVVDPIRIVAARSLWGRRGRAICVFLLGYLSVWVIAGMAISVAVTLLRLNEIHLAAALAFGFAALWQLTPTKWRALRSCHRTIPIAPQGWRADRDCLRYGWTIAGGCLLSCWALMTACSMAGHSIAAMTCLSGVGLAERYLMRPDQRKISCAIAGLALVYALTGILK